MKKVQQNLTRRAGMIGMICLLAATLSSCLKDDRNHYVEQQPVALLSVINASPDAQPVDFFLDKNRANNSAIRYGHGLDYLRAFTGTRVATFYTAGSNNKVASDTISLTANKMYSIYLANLVSKPDVILIADSISQPAAGKATIRLVNVSANAGKVDLVEKDSVLATNQAYKGASTFVPIKGGTTYTLQVRKTGTTTVLATITDVTLHSGSVYTVWLHGVAGATDDTKLTADIQKNVYYY